MDWRVFREPDLIPAGELPPLLRPGDVPTAKPGQTESRLLPEVNRRFAVAVGADRRCPPPAGSGPPPSRDLERAVPACRQQRLHGALPERRLPGRQAGLLWPARRPGGG